MILILRTVWGNSEVYLFICSTRNLGSVKDLVQFQKVGIHFFVDLGIHMLLQKRTSYWDRSSTRRPRWNPAACSALGIGDHGVEPCWVCPHRPAGRLDESRILRAFCFFKHATHLVWIMTHRPTGCYLWWPRLYVQFWLPWCSSRSWPVFYGTSVGDRWWNASGKAGRFVKNATRHMAHHGSFYVYLCSFTL